jgi:hypothetical protein
LDLAAADLWTEDDDGRTHPGNSRQLITLVSATDIANSWVAQGTAKIGFNIGAVFQFLSGMLTVLLMLLLGFGVTLST